MFPSLQANKWEMGDEREMGDESRKLQRHKLHPLDTCETKGEAFGSEQRFRKSEQRFQEMSLEPLFSSERNYNSFFILS